MSYDHYSRVWASIWMEPWCDDMRTVALYLLTGPHRRSEGLYRLPLQYASSDLRWPAKKLRAAFDALIADDFVEHDPDAQIVLVVNALKRHKLNDNQRKGVVKAIEDLPPTPLLERFGTLAKAFDEALWKELAKAFPRMEASLAN